jgi:hypothetical protein
MFCLKVVRYCMYMWLHSNHGYNGVVYFLYRMLPEVAATMFCLKVVGYCMYMWLHSNHGDNGVVYFLLLCNHMYIQYLTTFKQNIVAVTSGNIL